MLSSPLVAASLVAPPSGVCVSLDKGVPTITQPYVFLTTRTSFGAKVQEIGPNSACRPAGWSLARLASRKQEQEGVILLS